eukprot:scaffold1340_cov253-Pinguiococcus_pyrenoidosus.AAC.14
MLLGRILVWAWEEALVTGRIPCEKGKKKWFPAQTQRCTCTSLSRSFGYLEQISYLQNDSLEIRHDDGILCIGSGIAVDFGRKSRANVLRCTRLRTPPARRFHPNFPSPRRSTSRRLLFPSAIA